MSNHHASDGLHPDSLVVSSGRPAPSPDGNINPPISLNSTFFAGALEEAIGALEGGPTLVFASGMAAINAVFSLLPKGAVVTTSKNGYTGTMVVLAKLIEQEWIEVRYVDVSDTEEVLAALPGTALSSIVFE